MEICSVAPIKPLRYLELLKQGNEIGLSYYYKQFYDLLYFRAFKSTKEDCTALSIVQEAFLRLWLCRQQIENMEEVASFLKKQVGLAISTYFTKSDTRFQRSLLRLDGIEDSYDFIVGVPFEEEVLDLAYLDKLEEEKFDQQKCLEEIIPHLNANQQLFIQLCLKYSFNYDRIAFYLGGVSDYEVGQKVENAINTLRSIMKGNDKLDGLNKARVTSLNAPDFEELEQEVFRLRYTLQFSFEEISTSLNIKVEQVKKLFVGAHAKIKSRN